MSRLPAAREPSLAQRHAELQALALPEARIRLTHQRLILDVKLAPGAFGRLYTCRFIFERTTYPVVIVTGPDLESLAQGEKIPHVYPWNGPGTRLCLWWPKNREWSPQMKVVESLLPWTAEWLYYFELWLLTKTWEGGGEHPMSPKQRRWARPLPSSTS
jgi:hypothetical protein